MALPKIIQQINSKLSLSGGAFNKGSKLDFTGNDDEGYTRLNKSGGNGFFIENYDTASKIGSRLCLRSSIHSSYPGQFELDANDGVKKVVLKGNPNGTLTWGGSNVLTSIGGEVTGTLYTKGNIPYELRHTTVSNGDTTRESATYQMLCVGLDKDGKRGGGVEIAYGTGGTRSLSFTMRNRADDGWVSAGLVENANGSTQFNIQGQRAVALATNYRSGTQWYRKYADGFIEQGGRFSYTLTNSGFTKLSFVTAFTSTNYQILGSGYRSDSSPNQGFATFKDFSTSSCNVAFWDDSTSNPGVINWYACGY